MAKIDTRKLWNEDIISDAELLALLPQLFQGERGSLFPRVSFDHITGLPPIFIYQEHRGEHNDIQTFSYYGNKKGKNAQLSLGSRGLLVLSSTTIGEAERGKILNAFCRVDFILDVMIAIDCGVFDGSISYKGIEKLFTQGDGTFATTSRKIKYLRAKRLLSKETYDLLEKAKKVRNILAHQFMPEGTVGIAEDDLAYSETIPKAINTIYNACWFYLMKDYNDKQLMVAKWLATKAQP